jgi:Domain of unknown function (DUF4350)
MVAERPRGLLERLVEPRGVLVAFATMFLLGLLLVPWATAEDRSPALSSYGTAPAGARGLYDVLTRLGFPTQRRLRPFRDTLDTRAVYLVLAPSVPLTAGEVNRLLGAVRAGAGLFFVPAAETGLADSLGVAAVPTLAARATRDSTNPAGLREALDASRIRMVLRHAEQRDSATRIYAAGGATVFDSLRTERGMEPVVIGRPLGRGRVLIAADPTALHNATVRQGEPGVRVVRLVEWLRGDDVARPLVFDEYHHGFGTHADVLGFLLRALVGTPPGRTLFVLGLAGLLLLVALGVRPIRPTPQRRMQRRSPLEHVEALALAYAAVPATARAAQLLVRGLHRRHGGLRGRTNESAYLRALAARAPHVAGDVERVLDAVHARGDPVGHDELTDAILRIENAIPP